MFHSSSRTRKSSIRNRIIATPHGKIRTPFFMPDATQGAVKLIESEKIKTIGVPAMVVNTLHLYLQPGLKIIQKAGGIHQFMNWQGPLLSDSGGYQVFSLIYKTKGRAGKVYEDKAKLAALFISHSKKSARKVSNLPLCKGFKVITIY